MKTPRVRVWSNTEDLGRRSWRWTCPACHNGFPVLRGSHASALNHALRHLAVQHKHGRPDAAPTTHAG